MKINDKEGPKCINMSNECQWIESEILERREKEKGRDKKRKDKEERELKKNTIAYSHQHKTRAAHT